MEATGFVVICWTSPRKLIPYNIPGPQDWRSSPRKLCTVHREDCAAFGILKLYWSSLPQKLPIFDEAFQPEVLHSCIQKLAQTSTEVNSVESYTYFLCFFESTACTSVRNGMWSRALDKFNLMQQKRTHALRPEDQIRLDTTMWGWSEVTWKPFSRAQPFSTPWTILSMEFSRIEYRSG